MRNFLIVCFLLFISNFYKVYSQQVDVDSLLIKTIEEVNHSNFETAKKQARRGLKIAPDYVDFKLFLGRAHQLTTQLDSARHYYQQVIAQAPNYKDAYNYWYSLEMKEKAYQATDSVLTLAIKEFPEEVSFYQKKIEVIPYVLNAQEQLRFLELARKKFPENSEISQNYYLLASKLKTDRLGALYTYTTIDREGQGPWHLSTFQYVRERTWGSLVANINYNHRRSNGELLIDGLQFDLQSYFFTSKSDYSFLALAYSDHVIFPKLQARYSFFHNFNKGWEAELGARYTQTRSEDFYALVIGGSKYFGSFWLNLRSFSTYQDHSFYPVFAFRTRYYTNSRFDYWEASLGYGTSPDNTIVQNQIGERVSLESYNVGAAYQHLYLKKYLVGAKIYYNNLEFSQNKRQHEYSFFVQMSYLF
ncbi:YaiO family outer membrane beta-barrel protein [Mesonia aestuariivivens]|uniref:YaiO family outer membrane beta-barrel protein n=1 Tax=Mesonia aestuariivivens TaxID=2796128 RepID=A0ABS6VY48_9FLAO|nr:YaiO family outer membrane beta-barrel protein [Mesonia aestuariivivens]MBW2960500.1 YaiO family outer membrane beta-barrel protein [Mesonia aestuariivivens]